MTGEALRGVSAFRLAAPALALAALLLAPFAGKAFTIDDTVFLAQARHVLADPLHPTAFVMTWTEVPERVSGFLASGPTTAWILAPAAALGAPEWAAHLTVFLFLVAGLVATSALARRLSDDPLVARLAPVLVVASPAVLGMAGTAMPDVPAMALAAIGTERLLAARATGRTAPALAAAVALAFALLGRTHVVVLLPFLALAALVPGPGFGLPARPRDWVRAWPVALAAALAAVLLLLTRDPEAAPGGGLGAALWRLSAVDPQRILGNLFALGLHPLLVLPLGLVRLAGHGGRIVGRGRWLALPLLAVAMALAGFHRWALLAPVSALGLLVLVDLAREAWQGRDPLRIALVGALLAPVPALVYVQMPPKYLVVSAPAAALLAALDLARLPSPRRWRLAVPLLAGGLLLGVAILRADATFAGLGRRVAAEWIAPAVARGERVWFAGHWGFQHYAERAGGTILTTTGPRPQPGDLVVSAERADYEDLLRVVPGRDRRRLATIADRRPGGRILSRRAMAGFYTNWIGPLPWSWGNDEVERFELWRVEPGGGEGPP